MDKKIAGFFITILIFVVILLNWNSVSWMFNYRAVSSLAYHFFNPYPDSNLFIGKYDSENIDYSSKYSLIAPSVGLFTPIVIAKSTDKKVIDNALGSGAVYYPGSTLPGKDGQIIILGHSAPPNWPYMGHDWIFSRINNLNIGDKVTLKYEDKEYVYKVVEKSIVQPGQSISRPALSENGNILTLVSCWPPGGNEQRIAVTAELVEQKTAFQSS